MSPDRVGHHRSHRRSVLFPIVFDGSDRPAVFLQVVFIDFRHVEARASESSRRKECFHLVALTPEQTANLRWAAEEHMALPLEFFRGLISRAKLYEGARESTLNLEVVNTRLCSRGGCRVLSPILVPQISTPSFLSVLGIGPFGRQQMSAESHDRGFLRRYPIPSHVGDLTRLPRTFRPPR